MLFEEHRDVKRRLIALKQEVTALDERFTKKREELQRAKAALDEADPEARPRMEKALSASYVELSTEVTAAMRRLQEQEVRIYNETYDEVLAEVSEYAEARPAGRLSEIRDGDAEAGRRIECLDHNAPAH